MKRLGRWLLNALTVLSLLLCVGTAVLWVRSYWLMERWRHEDWTVNRFGDVTVSGRYWGWAEGTLYVGSDANTFGSGPAYRPALGPRRYFHRTAAGGSPLFWVTDGTQGGWVKMTPHRWGRFAFQREDASNGSSINEGDARGWTRFGRRRSLIVGVPLGFLTIVFGSLPGVLGCRLWRRRRTARAGKCPTCGYDLTGNVSGVCPECGTEIEGMA